MESVKKWLSERGVKRNGVYVHYSPPKVVGTVSSAQLRQLARGGTETMLERAVLAGQGRRMLAEADSMHLSHNLASLVAKCGALHAAVERGSLLDLQELLDSEYNRRKYAMCRDEAGVGLLHKAVFYDFIDIVEHLIKNYPQLVHQKDSEGRTALHYSAVCQDQASVAALLEGAGAVRGARDAAGRTAASYRGVARTLLALPTTDDMARDNSKHTPGLVIKRHNIRIWCHDCDMARLQRVVWEGHGARLLSEVSSQPVVKRFLEAVPYIMNTIRDIHNAVVQNNLEDVMKLSGDPVPPQILTSRDTNNMTVMHKAAGLGHVSIMKYLAERYPQGVNDVDNDGRTPLHYAAAMRDEQHTYNTLVALGADESAVDNKNKTPGYYINRPQEIDKNLLKNLPDAPRTPSSAYPTSWDWKLLDNDVITDLSKKSRRRNLKASTENISSKNNTSPLSESTEVRTNTMKASSTHELIKNLPELDDSNKVNSIDTAQGEVEENKQTTLDKETNSNEEECDDKSDSNHNKDHNEHQGEKKDDINSDNHDSDQTNVDNKDDSNHESSHSNQNEAEDENDNKGEDHDKSEHSDQNDVHNKSNNDECLNQNEDDHKTETQKENHLLDQNYAVENGKTPDTTENVNKPSKSSASIEYENVNNSIQENVEQEKVIAINISEQSPVVDIITKESSTNFAMNLDNSDYIELDEKLLGNMNEIIEEAKEVATVTEITDHRNEESLSSEDVKRKSATSGKQDITDQNLLQIENGETKTDNMNSVYTDEKDKTILEYHEEQSDIDKGKLSQVEKVHQENTSEEIETISETTEVIVEENNVNDTEPTENESSILTQHDIQHNEQLINVTEEGNNNFNLNEDDDDVQVQGNNHTEYNDLNKKNISESPDSGSAKRGNVIDGRNTQESLLEGIIGCEAEQDSQDATITERDESLRREVFVFESEIDPEVTDLINNANMEMLATLVLNGEGSRLIGRESGNIELQAFLDNVPTYMQKINRVHLAAKEGNIRELQAALDRRKFAIARDSISSNGATPLHVATIFGKTNIMKYLGGRFPETLSAVDFEGRTALHYAAVLPDNGHFYALLQQLGANCKDLDDNGRSAEDYNKNPSYLPFEQLLSDFAISEDDVKTMFSDKALSHGSNGHMDIPIFRTEEGRYLAQSLGDPLIKGLTEVANVKPKDPVAFLASFLQNFPESTKSIEVGNQKSNMIEVREEAELESIPPAKEQIRSVPVTNGRRSASRTATRSHRPIEVVTVEPPPPAFSADAPETAFSSANRDEHGQSMLHFAAARTHARNALFQLLQESDISLGYRDELYRTARDVSIQANVPENTVEIDKWMLHLAAKGNKEKIMELVLEGYDHIVDVFDADGVPITEVVTQRGDLDMAGLLTSIHAFEECRESLQSAVRRGDLAAVQEIVSAEDGRSIAKSHNSFGRTSLHVAILAQHEDIVAYLAQTYPELLRIGDNLERTPLHYAMGVEKIESLSWILIRAGAKRVLKDLKGRQPSYYFMNKSDILRLKEEEDVHQKT